MDEELIVVDDVPAKTRPLAQPNPPTEEQGMRSRSGRLVSSRLRAAIESERSTRSSTRGRNQPKLKLKLSEKTSVQGPGMSFLGPYDRELDSDDEELAFEEQFILRMPPGEDCEKLRKMVQAREVTSDVWFKFKDSRRAQFHIGNSLYEAKLVDLPCIIESQKTLDNKQMFKVADICQMLNVDKKVEGSESAESKPFNIEDFIWSHGLTPPLHWVRQRRFRKRVNRRTIESVEQEVERLLDEDSLASGMKYEILDNVNPDLSDSEFIEREDEPMDASTPGVSDLGEPMTPGADAEDYGEAEEEGEEDDEDDEAIDEELAAELNLALEEGEDEGDEEEEEEESEEEDDDDDDDDEEDVQARKLLNEEINDLEAAVAKKKNEVSTTMNPILKRRFEDALKKLSSDLDLKLAQREDLKERQRRKREGVPEPTQEASGEDDMGDDLFGSDPMGMDME
ncbi:hypothetical protein FISHEDRAFT_68015 [Fistulina hepatica ATCC 64428]|nr:hypothetical protein FISHEDRAFT_68015 [Fistulina hepatica ATCC 64428]